MAQQNDTFYLGFLGSESYSCQCLNEDRDRQPSVQEQIYEKIETQEYVNAHSSEDSGVKISTESDIMKDDTIQEISSSSDPIYDWLLYDEVSSDLSEERHIYQTPRISTFEPKKEIYLDLLSENGEDIRIFSALYMEPLDDKKGTIHAIELKNPEGDNEFKIDEDFNEIDISGETSIQNSDKELEKDATNISGEGISNQSKTEYRRDLLSENDNGEDIRIYSALYMEPFDDKEGTFHAIELSSPEECTIHQHDKDDSEFKIDEDFNEIDISGETSIQNSNRELEKDATTFSWKGKSDQSKGEILPSHCSSVGLLQCVDKHEGQNIDLLRKSTRHIASHEITSSSRLTIPHISSPPKNTSISQKVVKVNQKYRLSFENALEVVNAIYYAAHRSACTAWNLSNHLSDKLLDYIRSHPWIDRSVSYISESSISLGDRVNQKVNFLALRITSDDPETKYLKKYNYGGISWIDALNSRMNFATLSWKKRNLIKEGGLQNVESSDDSQLIGTHAAFRSKVDPGASDNVKSVPVPLKGLSISKEDLVKTVDAALCGDDEAQYTLAKWFCAPPFEEKMNCHVCKRYFGVHMFRHSCRNCGKSFCNSHSLQRRRILHYGFITPERVCDSCAVMIDKEESLDEHLWKNCRIQAFLEDNLLPYRSPEVDRVVDKMHRVFDYSVGTLKQIPLFTFPVQVALESMFILKRFGMAGLAGVLLRRDFVEAVETLKKISGLDTLFAMTLHELTGCIYYKLAVDRGVRGCIPDEESNSHSGTEEEVEEFSSHDLNLAIHIAPLALKAVYEDSETENQRIAQSQGWSLIYCETQSKPEQPSFSLYATKNKGKRAVLAIRGTHSIEDVVTDIRAAPWAFPPSEYVVSKAIQGEVCEEDDCSVVSATSSDNWEWIGDVDKRYACGGMARATLWVLQQVGVSLLRMAAEGYDIVITGHSLGGAIAAMLTYLLVSTSTGSPIPSAHAVTFGCPACISADIADELSKHVLAVILRDDVIARITPQSIRHLMKELLKFRSQVFFHMEQDWGDIMERAGSIWSPRWREIHSNSNNSRSIISNHKVERGGEYSPSKLEEHSSDWNNSLVIVAEEKIADLWVPGRIAHIYSHCGRYHAKIVKRDMPTLRQIEVQGNMLMDHTADSIFNALIEVKAVRCSIASPPSWQAYDKSERCHCCHNSFTWESTFKGETQEYRGRHNCRYCGSLVCDACSQKNVTIPKFGMLFPVRICDNCYYKGDYASNVTSWNSKREQTIESIKSVKADGFVSSSRTAGNLLGDMLDVE